MINTSQAMAGCARFASLRSPFRIPCEGRALRSWAQLELPRVSIWRRKDSGDTSRISSRIMRLLRWQLMRCPQASDSLTYHRLEIEKKNPPMYIYRNS